MTIRPNPPILVFFDTFFSVLHILFTPKTTANSFFEFMANRLIPYTYAIQNQRPVTTCILNNFTTITLF